MISCQFTEILGWDFPEESDRKHVFWEERRVGQPDHMFLTPPLATKKHSGHAPSWKTETMLRCDLAPLSNWRDSVNVSDELDQYVDLVSSQPHHLTLLQERVFAVILGRRESYQGRDRAEDTIGAHVTTSYCRRVNGIVQHVACARFSPCSLSLQRRRLFSFDQQPQNLYHTVAMDCFFFWNMWKVRHVKVRDEFPV